MIKEHAKGQAPQPAGKSPGPENAPESEAAAVGTLGSTRAFSLSGTGLLAVAAPALLLLFLSFKPDIGTADSLSWQLRVAAVVLLVWFAVQSRRGPLAASIRIYKVDLLQGAALVAVYVCWRQSWPRAGAMTATFIAQVCVAYAVDALLAWSRGRRWIIGVAHLPMVWSLGLFFSFKETSFGLQLATVALAVAGKELIRSRRGGVDRPVFNPVGLAISVASVLLVVTGRTDLGYGADLGLSQDGARHIHERLLVVALILGLRSPRLLVTASAALTLWVLGAVYTVATGVYMFALGAIPAAVLACMVFLLSDPETTPDTGRGKALFGAAYGALVFASFPILERLGSFGYLATFLFLPLLNVLASRFDRPVLGRSPVGAAPPDAVAPGSLGWVTAPAGTHYATIAACAGMFLALRLTHAVGETHPGRSSAFWQKACAANKPNACAWLRTRYEFGCKHGSLADCAELSQVLMDSGNAELSATGWDNLLSTCRNGFAPSCTRAGDALRLGRGVATDSGRSAAFYSRGCDGNDLPACHQLGEAFDHGRGTPRDPASAFRLYEKACKGGHELACTNVAKLIIARPGATDAEKAQAAVAFRRTCDAGDPASCSHLAFLSIAGGGVPRDLVAARALLKRACDGKYAAACTRLSDLLWNGEGGPMERDPAAEIRAVACDLGDTPACTPLNPGY